MAYCEFDINRHFETKISLYVEDLDVLQASEGVVRRAQDFRPSSTPRGAMVTASRNRSHATICCNYSVALAKPNIGSEAVIRQLAHIKITRPNIYRVIMSTSQTSCMSWLCCAVRDSGGAAFTTPQLALFCHRKAPAQDELRQALPPGGHGAVRLLRRASNAAPAPASVPIYYGRPNNGGYPYPTPTPATKPYENKTETPTPPSGPIYYGRPNNGGYPYPTPAPHDPEGSYSSENGTVTPAPANVPIYYGRPNNGGYPYTTAPPQTIKEH